MPFVEYVLAVDIGGTKIEAGIVGVDGTIVDRRRAHRRMSPTPRHCSFD